MAGVLLVADASGEQLPPTLAELIAEGQRVASALSADAPVVALVGKNVQALAASLGELGVARVLVADSASPLPPAPDWLLDAAEQAARQLQPDVILLTHSAIGRELASGLAYRLDTGIVTDCTALRVDGGDLEITKPVLGGSAIAEFSISSTPKVATLRPRAFEANESPTAVQAQVEALDVPAPDGKVEVLEEIREQASSGPRLKDAKIIVSG